MTESELITTTPELEAFCAELARATYVAVDTEFVRERTYYPRLCLVQVASESTIACIDAIALDNLAPLMSVLLNPTITKAFHAGRQDLEIFLHICNEIPKPIFDTQIAADLCGLGDQAGLASVVAQLIDVELDKTHTRTDWSKRPLSEQQLQYALDDVRYLLPVYEILKKRVGSLGRAAWLEEDCARQTDPDIYSVTPNEAWQRVGGIRRLRDERFHAACELAAWRERRAMAVDRPRGWILRDDALVAIASAMPATIDELSHIEGVPRALVRNVGEDVLKTIRGSRDIDSPTPVFQEPLTGDQRKVVASMMSTVRKTAEQLGLSPSTLATRRDVTQLLLGNRDMIVLNGWRRDAIGERLLTLCADA